MFIFSALSLSLAHNLFFLFVEFFLVGDHRHAPSFILPTSAFFAWLLGVGVENYWEGGKERSGSSLAGDEAWGAVEYTSGGGLREDVR